MLDDQTRRILSLLLAVSEEALHELDDPGRLDDDTRACLLALTERLHQVVGVTACG